MKSLKAILAKQVYGVKAYYSAVKLYGSNMAVWYLSNGSI